MEAAIEAIDRELEALHAERQALRADYERQQQRLDAREEALRRARELLEAAVGDAPPRKQTSRARHVDGPDAETVAQLYPSTTNRTTTR